MKKLPPNFHGKPPVFTTTWFVVPNASSQSHGWIFVVHETLGLSPGFWASSIGVGSLGGGLFLDITTITYTSEPSNALNLCYQLTTSFPLGVSGVINPQAEVY